MGAAYPPWSAEVAQAPVLDWRALLASLPSAAFVARGGHFLFVNEALAQCFGYAASDMTEAMRPLDLVVPEDRETVRVHVRRRQIGLPETPYEIQCQHRDGRRFDVRLCGIRLPAPDGPVDLVTLQDVSDTRQTLNAAQIQLELLNGAVRAQQLSTALLSHLPVPVIVADAQACIRHANEAACQLLGYSQAELQALTIYAIAPHRRPDAWLEGLQSLKQTGPRILPSDWCTAKGRTLQVQLSAAWFAHADEDLVAIALLEHRLQADVGRDPSPRASQFCDVTGLPNQHKLREHLRSEALLAIMDRRNMAVLAFAIHDWERISKAEGYGLSDQLLRVLSRRLGIVPKGPDMLAHIGGGEFVLIYSHTSDVDDDVILQLSRGIQEAITAPVHLDQKTYALHSSMGVVIFPRDTNEPDHVLRQAQSAMRMAASLGPNRMHGYTPESNAKFSARLAREAALRGALERGEFHLSYQPQVDLSDGRIVGVEALLRWHHPELGEVSPVDFIPIAEDTGQIIAIGAWVLTQACEAAVRWQHAGLPAVRMAVNLSARQLEMPEIVSVIETVLQQTGLSPRYLTLELTEGMLHDDQDALAKTLGRLKAMGLSMALDDFGTGYSSLQLLRRLPIDIIKIDRSLVPDVTAEVQDVSITRAIINMAHAMQKKVLAVGVESAGELALLCANQCDQIQGFHFSPAVVEAELVAMLHEGKRLPDAALGRQRRQRTLLIVDDDANIVSSLRRLLRPDGYHIVTATCGQEGLQRLAENEVDVIISDQRMPGMTGVEFLQRTKALYPETIRMVLSGFTELRTVTSAINEGAIYKFLTKPWDDEHVRRHIQEAFHQKEMADENKRLNREVAEANQELADVNSRLQHLLSSQREHLHREETKLVVAREMLENIPAPVIGLDQNGMVAFMNPDAEALLEGAAAMLGQHLDDVAGGALAEAWRAGDGVCREIGLSGSTYRVVCRPLTGNTRSRGAILVLYPPTTATPTKS
jgi:diguanylate cyclase (GGDEF)-like protein/PAS domain S-box-containing protein